MLKKTLWIVSISVSLYLLLGMVCFHFLEGGHEEEHHTKISSYLVKFLAENPCLNRSALQDLIETVTDATAGGVTPSIDNTSIPSTHWDLYSAFFFSGTVITTIGYGNITPKTEGGMAFCVIYAMFGIPLCLTMLSGIGEKFNKFFCKINKKMDICDKNPTRGKILRCFLIISIGSILFLFLPSVIFHRMEGWSYGVALYFVVITLTTIGFGDYVPGTQPSSLRGLYRVCTTFWAYVGLAWLSTVFSNVQEVIAEVTTKKIEVINEAEEMVADKEAHKNTELNEGNTGKGSNVESKPMETD